MWREELKENIQTIDELKKYIQLTKDEKINIQKIIKRHPMSITKFYLSLINFNNPDDLIKKMIVPSLDEMNLSGSYDTSGEKSNTKFIGLQHKYPQTALILSTNMCASYCRFCFRKRMVGVSTNEIINNLKLATKYISEHKEINNVLITGGDSLMLSTKIIQELLLELSIIPHLQFIRFGTKIPVFLPN